MPEPLKCIHRHTIYEHPACFIKHKNFWLPKNFFQKHENPQFYDYLGLKIGFFDIETVDLEADWAWMVTWAIKPLGDKNVTWSAITQKEILSRKFDKRIVQELITEMRKYDLLVGYFSQGFDFPFARARAMYWNLDFPKRGELSQIDLYFQVRGKLALSRKSLNVMTNHLGISGKTKLGFSYWKLASLGFEPELSKLVEHNVADVEITEKLFRRVAPYCKFNQNSI